MSKSKQPEQGATPKARLKSSVKFDAAAARASTFESNGKQTAGRRIVCESAGKLILEPDGRVIAENPQEFGHIEEVSTVTEIAKSEHSSARLAFQIVLILVVAGGILFAILDKLITIPAPPSPGPTLDSQKMVNIDLSQYANAALDWVIKFRAHVNEEELFSANGVSYRILKEQLAVVGTKGLLSPELPSNSTITLGERTGVQMVHLLLNCAWIDEAMHHHVGEVVLKYADGYDQNVDLNAIQTVGPTWFLANMGLGASPVPPPAGVRWTNVYRESQTRKDVDSTRTRDAFGVLDDLSIKTDPTRTLESIEIRNNDENLGLLLTAITLVEN